MLPNNSNCIGICICLPYIIQIIYTRIFLSDPCPSGQVYDECAYNCEQMCFSFVYEMSEKCNVAKNGCIAGCRPEIGCIFPNVWRDYYTCVSKDECTCLYTEGDKLTVMAVRLS